MSDRRSRKVTVIGAGPVGCLAALAMAKIGFSVDVYEGRPDLRLPSSKANLSRRSVNLAVSARGLAALEFVDPALATRFLNSAIPMRARIIHDGSGNTESQPYDRNGQYLNSVDRGLLNEALLNEASVHESINLHFQHKLVTADFDAGTMVLERKGTDHSKESISVNFDLCIGADGSYSNVRRQLMRVVRMDYQQEYIPHEYIELRLPSGALGESSSPTFLLEPNGLHIWPRHSFMLIALPNKDGSFTCTLFAPNSILEPLTSREGVISWFKEHFPDAVQLIGEELLVEDFLTNPRSPLISIKANPYHYKDKVIILGDAAHSMVPFYGQGLNCGLEDVRILTSMLLAHAVDPTTPLDASYGSIDQNIALALAAYSKERHNDLVAICDLAMQNYVEMRHSVTTPLYRMRKTLDSLLSRVVPASAPPKLPGIYVYQSTDASRPMYPLAPRSLPGGWLSLYTMVTFRPDIPYSLAKEKDERQGRLLQLITWNGVGVASLGLVWAARAWLQSRPTR